MIASLELSHRFLDAYTFFRQNISPKITHEDTVMRLSIPAVQRLAITLRYLATGNSYHDLHYQFLVGISTIHYLIKETCEALWDTLMPIYMPEKTSEDWLIIAQQFYERTNFPNALGAIDGKHIEMCKPKNSGSLYYNYKNYFSIVLMAVADANFCFISIEIGAYGGSSDSNIFKKSVFHQKMISGELGLPQARRLPKDEQGIPMPFVFVGDEAFALSNNIIRPYGSRNLNRQQRIFNYRLTRARRMVECTFGILSHKWRILNRALDVGHDRAVLISKTCCILHNYVRAKDGFQFEETFYDSPLANLPTVGVRGTSRGVEVRDYFSTYFSTVGSVPWQFNAIREN